MHQLFKTFARSPVHRHSAFRFQQLGMASRTSMRIFSTSSDPHGAAQTGLGDVGEIFKTNYTVEFDQGLTDE
jgi:hypothetical protein